MFSYFDFTAMPVPADFPLITQDLDVSVIVLLEIIQMQADGLVRVSEYRIADLLHIHPQFPQVAGFTGNGLGGTEKILYKVQFMGDGIDNPASQFPACGIADAVVLPPVPEGQVAAEFKARSIGMPKYFIFEKGLDRSDQGMVPEHESDKKYPFKSLQGLPRNFQARAIVDQGLFHKHMQALLGGPLEPLGVQGGWGTNKCPVQGKLSGFIQRVYDRNTEFFGKIRVFFPLQHPNLVIPQLFQVFDMALPDGSPSYNKEFHECLVFNDI